jgi:hypothetical protein
VLGLSGVEFTNVREAAPFVSVAFGVVLLIAAFLPGRGSPSPPPASAPPPATSSPGDA